MIRLNHPSHLIEAQFNDLVKFMNEPFVNQFRKQPDFITFRIDPNAFIYASFKKEDVVIGHVVTGTDHYLTMFQPVELDELRPDQNNRRYSEIVSNVDDTNLVEDFRLISQRILQRQYDTKPQTAPRMYSLLLEIQQLAELE